MLGFKEIVEELIFEKIVDSSMAEPNPMFTYFYYCFS